jgi:heme oxygenase (mycobilin-producing)
MTDTEPVTFINVFEVPADELDAFLANWVERAEIMSTQPGLRSFRLHRALSPDSRFQMINVAEWDSAEALQAATANPAFQASIRAAAETFDVTASPGLFCVAYEFTGSAG